MKKFSIGIAAFLCSLAMTTTCFADYDTATIQQVQQALNEAGFDCGTPDGIAGKGTAAAVSAYQEANGLTVDGQINDELLGSLGLLQESETAQDQTEGGEAVQDHAEGEATAPSSGEVSGDTAATFDETLYEGRWEPVTASDTPADLEMFIPSEWERLNFADMLQFGPEGDDNHYIQIQFRTIDADEAAIDQYRSVMEQNGMSPTNVNNIDVYLSESDSRIEGSLIYEGKYLIVLISENTDSDPGWNEMASNAVYSLRKEVVQDVRTDERIVSPITPEGDDHQYTISVPATWNVQERDGGYNFFAPGIADIDATVKSFVRSLEENPLEESLESIRSRGTFSSETEEDINGINAVVFTTEEDGYIREYAILINEKNTIGVSITPDQKHYTSEEWNALADEIIHSITEADR